MEVKSGDDVGIKGQYKSQVRRKKGKKRKKIWGNHNTKAQETHNVHKEMGIVEELGGHLSELP